MSGPSIKRGGMKQGEFEKQYGVGSFSAALPQLTRGVTDLLQGAVTDPQQYMRGILGTQQQQATRSIEQLLSGQIGSDIVPSIQQSAALGLREGAAEIRQGGSRFASAAGQQIGDLTRKVNIDTNLAVAQAKERAAGRRMNELLAAGQLAGQQGQLALGAINPALNAAFSLGTGAPVLEKSRGFWGTVGDIASLGLDVASVFNPMGGGPSGNWNPQAQTVQLPQPDVQFGGPMRPRSYDDIMGYTPALNLGSF